MVKHNLWETLIGQGRIPEQSCPSEIQCKPHMRVTMLKELKKKMAEINIYNVLFLTHRSKIVAF
jgi:hypothetical protein